MRAGEGEMTGHDASEIMPAPPERVQVTPAIVLVEPQLGENIGTAARAMANFALDDLRIVAPHEPWPNAKAVAASSGAHWVLDKARVFSDLREAVADLNYVFATTARARDMVKPVMLPETAVEETRRRQVEGQACGILFGRERWGLENDALSYADALVMVPVNPVFASLNLAQAVLLIGYEWFKSGDRKSLGRQTRFDGRSKEGTPHDGSRPANKAELYGFYEHLERELDESAFLQPPEKRPTMVRNVRNMFARMEATEQEIRTLRGIIASLCRAHRPRPK
jgi:tRNA/rRNA methyltransferase